MLDYKLKPNSRILKFNTRVMNKKTIHYSTVKSVYFKSISEPHSEAIKILNTVFNNLNVHVSNFYIIGESLIRVVIHISVLSEDDMIVSIIKDFKLEEINQPTKAKFKNELYKLIRSYKLNYDKYV